MKIKQTAVTLMLLALGSSLVMAVPLSSAFTYQGQLFDGTNAANGIYDFRFKLYDGAATDPAIDGPITERRRERRQWPLYRDPGVRFHRVQRASPLAGSGGAH